MEDFTRIQYGARVRPGVYAKLEQAENLIRARRRKRLSREDALEVMADTVLPSATARTQVRYMVHVHVDGITGEAWVSTGRGLVPAEPGLLQAALDSGHIHEVRTQPEDDLVPRPDLVGADGAPVETAADQAAQAAATEQEEAPAPDPGTPAVWDQEAGPLRDGLRADAEGSREGPSAGVQAPERDGGGLPQPRSRAARRRRRRQAVPVALLRRIYARAGGCCERCRACVPLDGSHLDPYSENPVNDEERMRLLCWDCHDHDEDFETRPDWRAARDAAIRRRREKERRRVEEEDTRGTEPGSG